MSEALQVGERMPATGVRSVPPAGSGVLLRDTSPVVPSHLLLTHERPANICTGATTGQFEQLLQPTFALYMQIRK